MGSSYGAVMAHMARSACAAGHRVTALLRDPQLALNLVQWPAGAAVLAGPPLEPARSRGVRLQTSYATLLHNAGFDAADGLARRLRAWLRLFEAHRIERLIVRHSPTAVLAARIAGLPVFHYGTGFSLPPQQTPWPSFRPDLRIPEQVLAHNEMQVLRTVNTALDHFGTSRLVHLSDLYAGLPCALIGYPELDHYARPEPLPWVGLPSLAYGNPPHWSSAPTMPRIFASLLPEAIQLGWLEILAQLPAHSLVRCLGPLPAQHAVRSNVDIVHDAINYTQAIAQADLVMGYGSHNLACEALLAGKPLAVIAHNPEQLLLGRRLESLGAGILLPEIPGPQTAEILRAFLGAQKYTVQAQSLADRYRQQPRDAAPEALLRIALVATSNPR